MTRTIISVPKLVTKDIINRLKKESTPVNDFLLSEMKEGLERKMYAQMHTLAKTVILLRCAYGSNVASIDRAVHEFKDIVERTLNQDE